MISLKKAIFASAITSLLFSSGVALADVPAKLPVPISMMKIAGLKVENSFPAAGGMTGWILSKGDVGKPMLAFTPADGSAIIVGANIISAEGENLGEKYIKQYAPAPDLSGLYNSVEKSSWVATGATGSKVKSSIYVFFDPNCGYCHLTWKALQPYEDAGLQVRWVIVGILGQSSVTKASYILGSEDKTAALNLLMANKDWRPSKADEATVKAGSSKVDANTALMSKSGFGGTPAIVYKDSAKVAKAVSGFPDISDLPEITGLPAQKQTDPAILSRMK